MKSYLKQYSRQNNDTDQVKTKWYVDFLDKVLEVIDYQCEVVEIKTLAILGKIESQVRKTLPKKNKEEADL